MFLVVAVAALAAAATAQARPLSSAQPEGAVRTQVLAAGVCLPVIETIEF